MGILEIEYTIVDCETFKEARALCPWANAFAHVFSGIACFKTLGDYQAWRWR